MLAAQLQLVTKHVLENDRAIRQTARASAVGRLLMEIPGVGPLLASALVAGVPDPPERSRHGPRFDRSLQS